MKRIEQIERLTDIQHNIEATERKIKNAKTSMYYYSGFGTKAQQKRDIEVQEKCLAYWKRKFNRVLLTLGYKL